MCLTSQASKSCLGENWRNWSRRSHWCKMTRTIVAWIFPCISRFRLFHSLLRLLICLVNQRYSEYISLYEKSFTLHVTHICARRVYVYVCSIDFYEVQRPNILIITLALCFWKEAKLRLYLILWFLFEETRTYSPIVVINFILITAIICT